MQIAYCAMQSHRGKGNRQRGSSLLSRFCHQIHGAMDQGGCYSAPEHCVKECGHTQRELDEKVLVLCSVEFNLTTSNGFYEVAFIKFI